MPLWAITQFSTLHSVEPTGCSSRMPHCVLPVIIELLIVATHPDSTTSPAFPCPWSKQLSIAARMRVEPLAGWMTMPFRRLLRIVEPVTNNWPPAVRASRMAVPASFPDVAWKPKISQVSM